MKTQQSSKIGFRLFHTSGRARAGALITGHGEVDTPVFMPVGTQGAVKALEQRELEELGAQIVLSNTYHLYLRPGEEVLKTAGGLHNFAAWKKAILTDSGGFQIFSLSDLRTITNEGVVFKSHLDGSSHMFTPERVIEIQRVIGSDIMMQLDECVPSDSPINLVEEAMERTIHWAERSIAEYERRESYYGFQQMLFGIVQGGVSEELREKCVDSLKSMPFHGYAIGGLAVGEPVEEMYRVTRFTAELLPVDKPRYLMGVGTPENLLTAIEFGMDIFDCVIPTRNARNGMLFTLNGSINIRNSNFKTDNAVVDEDCSCYTCRTFTRSYIRHLFNAREILGLQLATIHNTSFYLTLMRNAREAILRGDYSQWKKQVIEKINNN